MVWSQNPFDPMSYHSATPATEAYLLIWEHTQNLPISRFFICSSPSWNFSLTCSPECLVSSLTYPISNTNSFAHNSGISLFFILSLFFFLDLQISGIDSIYFLFCLYLYIPSRIMKARAMSLLLPNSKTRPVPGI